MQLDLDITSLKVRDQSATSAWTDQYPDINILTNISKVKYENLEYQKNERYIEMANNLKLCNIKYYIPEDEIKNIMKETNIFTSNSTFYRLNHSNMKKDNLILPVLFLLFMGLVGVIISLMIIRRGKNVY